MLLLALGLHLLHINFTMHEAYLCLGSSRYVYATEFATIILYPNCRWLLSLVPWLFFIKIKTKLTFVLNPQSVKALVNFALKPKWAKEQSDIELWVTGNAVCRAVEFLGLEGTSKLTQLLWCSWTAFKTHYSLIEEGAAWFVHLKSVLYLMKTYLHLLKNLIVLPLPSLHHQNSCSLHKLLFKLVSYQTRISVLLSYSVWGNDDKEMLCLCK